MKRKIFIALGVLFLFPLIIVGLIIGHIVYGIFIGENQDDMLLNHVQEVTDTLHKYQEKYHTYPKDLKAANISDKYCVTKCFNLKYKLYNKETFYLATNANSPFIVFASSTNSGGFGLVENYNGTRKDIPIYKKDSHYFPNADSWPPLEKSFNFLQILD